MVSNCEESTSLSGYQHTARQFHAIKKLQQFEFWTWSANVLFIGTAKPRLHDPKIFVDIR